MSNIHGFNNLNRNNNRQESSHHFQPQRNQPRDPGIFDQQDPLTIQNLRNAQLHKVIFLSGHRKIKRPNEQNYFDMVSQICCPTFKLISFTTLILIVTLIMFIVQVSLGLQKSGQFLQVQGSTLLDLGANYTPYLKEGQVYRLLAPIFLHVNFLHFFGNMMAIFMFLSRVEYTFGPLQSAVIYIGSGIGGNLLSAWADTINVKAGASTSLYGLIGVILGYLIINWNGLDIVGPTLKCQLFCQSMMIIIFVFFFSVLGTKNVDAMGHLGGFLSGLWLSAIHKTITNQTYQKVLRIIFAFLFLIQIILCCIFVFKQ